MTEVNYANDRAFARLAGAGYLTIAVSGGFAIAYVPTAIAVDGDAVQTMTALINKRALFLAGIGGDIVMMLAEIAVTVMLFLMFRHLSPALSAAAALARFAMVGVMAAMLFFSAAALGLAEGDLLPALDKAARADWVALMLYLDQVGVWIWQLFFALHLMLLGPLVMRSGLYPRIVGLALAIGGTGYLLDSAYAFAFPNAEWLGALRVGLLALVTLAEVSFALILLFRGPKERAVSPALA